MRTSKVARHTPLVTAILATLQTAAVQVQAAESEAAQQLPKISVGAEAEDSYKEEILSSPKYTELARDTPQTVTVIPQQLINDQKLLTMRDILSTVPGITFGAGEGGGGYGDSITIRGFIGSSDIMTDGVRDSAQYTRSDSFNLQQVEVVNGASSVYAGAGSVGGSVNLVSKVAGDMNSSILSASAGTDDYARVTADVNQQFGEHSAIRLNVMGHQNDVAGRDYEQFERWGVAPSLALGLGTNTTVTLSYLHQIDDNIPQYGVPFFNGRPLAGVDSSNYYGYNNIDSQEIDTDSLTAVITHRFADNLSLRNLSRVQEVGQLTIVDAVQGTWCLENNLTPTGTPCVSGTGAAAITVPPGVLHAKWAARSGSRHDQQAALQPDRFHFDVRNRRHRAHGSQRVFVLT
jgi:catecholate siderophore receptor